jgi:hypothetical protein
MVVDAMDECRDADEVILCADAAVRDVGLSGGGAAHLR